MKPGLLFAWLILVFHLQINTLYIKFCIDSMILQIALDSESADKISQQIMLSRLSRIFAPNILTCHSRPGFMANRSVPFAMTMLWHVWGLPVPRAKPFSVDRLKIVDSIAYEFVELVRGTVEYDLGYIL